LKTRGVKIQSLLISATHLSELSASRFSCDPRGCAPGTFVGLKNRSGLGEIEKNSQPLPLIVPPIVDSAHSILYIGFSIPGPVCLEVSKLHAASFSAAQLVMISLPFMEPDSSLPCSQGPAVGPYPEPDASSPHYRILFI